MSDTLPHESVPQKVLTPAWMVTFLVLMNMFIPLSTDLYLPALPTMGVQFGCSAAVVNLSLSLFFFFFALGVLVFGPFSDKHGRKPILLLGLGFYLLSTLVCALAPNVVVLIGARILQGISAGGITSVSMAIIKDVYSGAQRGKILAVTQALTGLAPMVAPVLGAWILTVSTWRVSFLVLVVIGLATLGLALAFTESLRKEDRYSGSLWGALGRLVVVCQNKSVLFPILIFALSAVPFMGYLSISSFIYVDQFKLSEQQYSWFFAANALVSLVGPVLYVRVFMGSNKKLFAAGCFAVSLVSGILVLTLGSLSPFLFWGAFVLMSLVGTVSRPFSTNLVFDQHAGDAGALSSILGTTSTVMGSLGMVLASLPWGDNLVFSLGVLITLFSALSLGAWVWFLKSSIPCVGVKD